MALGGQIYTQDCITTGCFDDPRATQKLDYTPTALPGVGDVSLFDIFKSGTAQDSGGVIGGVFLNSAASQDVPQGGDTRKVTDYTATTAKPQDVESSPGTFRLLWNRSEEHTSELQSRLHLVCRL